MTHITDYGGAIDDYYPARIERIADMELTEWEKRADIEAEKSQMKPEALDGGWQPIKTAPKDGTKIFIWARWDWDDMDGQDCDKPYALQVARYEGFSNDGGFWSESFNPYSDRAVNPTHWMPLPEPPK